MRIGLAFTLAITETERVDQAALGLNEEEV
jgi:hypothetical protein